MNPDQLFQIVNLAVLPCWLLLAVAPDWIWTRRVVHSIAPGLVFGSLYVFLLATAPSAPGDAGFGSLAGVAALFEVPEALLAGWVHYLVFDLFVGAWIARDAHRRSINRWLMVPVLFLTLMLGPAGLLAYALLRAALRRTTTLVEAG